jgi:uncharacterized protein YcfJ
MPMSPGSSTTSWPALLLGLVAGGVAGFVAGGVVGFVVGGVVGFVVGAVAGAVVPAVGMVGEESSFPQPTRQSSRSSATTVTLRLSRKRSDNKNALLYLTFVFFGGM